MLPILFKQNKNENLFSLNKLHSYEGIAEDSLQKFVIIIASCHRIFDKVRIVNSKGANLIN